MPQYRLITAYPGIPAGTVYTPVYDGNVYRNAATNSWFSLEYIVSHPANFEVVV